MEVLFDDLNSKLNASISIYKKDIAGIRTGRASAHLLDCVVVEAYSNRVPIQQVATVNVVDQKTISVQVWDKELVKSVAKGIESAIGICPISEGQSIRVILPAITEERRKELCKLAAKQAEAAKVVIRNIRRDFMDKIKKMEKNKEINEDEQKRASDRIQKIIDENIKKIDVLSSDKEKEIMVI